MGTEDRKPGKAAPVKFQADIYADLKLLARVQGKDISELAAELIRAPLDKLKDKLGPEIAVLRKKEEELAALAAKARRKVESAESE